MTRLAHAAVGSMVSLALHGGFVLVVAAFLLPRPMPQQPLTRSELMMAVVRVPEVQGAAVSPDASDARTAKPAGGRADPAVVPIDVARPAALPVTTLRSQPTAQSVLSRSDRPDSQTVAATNPPVQVLSAKTGSGEQAPNLIAEPSVAVSIARTETRVVSSQPTLSLASSTRPQTVNLDRVSALGTSLSEERPVAGTAAEKPASASGVDSLVPISQPARVYVPPSAVAAVAALTETRLTPSLDWSPDGVGELDATTLSAVEAFLVPSGATEVRDGIRAAMMAVDCARMRTEFDPVTGRVRLLGHIPADDLRATALSAVGTQLGSALKIEDGLRILPHPQCDVLGQIEASGLPQSEEQFKDAAMIGAQGFAREYAFRQGELLRIDLTAPDYDAYVYVDYFDGEGQVLHLDATGGTPPLRPAGDVFSVPGSRDGEPSMKFEIAPPFGQDIVLTIAVNAPLYNSPRPLVETAPQYLDFLRERMSLLMAKPGFKGEWAYLFVATTAADKP
ncbi:DUF4384 domain-containing protein [Ruegeria aquimaris]|uniref:DUF4384 domain-containing protein n=1 Tax=Ruegeria aquimaris TaxID=2984333 RepID=A0ABT3ANQ2_9RHOB|nr:DUF4384 domain-containing protein [Ruegeria sp. XHP0148]MCV2890315.1 DUF4384 domain-containing protein [Ruegeria sp. XHP0148]